VKEPPYFWNEETREKAERSLSCSTQTQSNQIDPRLFCRNHFAHPFHLVQSAFLVPCCWQGFPSEQKEVSKSVLHRDQPEPIYLQAQCPSTNAAIESHLAPLCLSPTPSALAVLCLKDCLWCWGEDRTKSFMQLRCPQPM
jgi:hypothetical protein